MAINTYATLQTAVANWLDRSDLTDRIPEFIALAEARMNRNLRLALMLNVDQTTLGGATTLVAGTRDYDLPSGYLQMVDFHLRTAPITTLSYITPENMNRMWAGSQLGINILRCCCISHIQVNACHVDPASSRWIHTIDWIGSRCQYINIRAYERRN